MRKSEKYKNVKRKFGEIFRRVRDDLGLSRATLALRLNISPKTIQSWEGGRTFIEDLSLIPTLESELGVSISSLIAEAVGRAPGVPSTKQKAETKAGPVISCFNVVPIQGAGQVSAKRLAAEWVAVPLLKNKAVAKPVTALEKSDIAQHVIIPAAWVPRGCGLLVAYRSPDNGLRPVLTKGSIAIVDRRPVDPQKAMQKIVAFWTQEKGLKLRYLAKHERTGRLIGAISPMRLRGWIRYRPKRGDMLLGRVIGEMREII